MGLLDSILGGLAGGVGSGMRGHQAGGGLQAQLLQALVAIVMRRAGQGAGAAAGGAAGGLGGLLGGLLGGGSSAATAGTGGGGGMLGGLGGMGALAGIGLLVEKLRQGGLGDAAASWIGTGPNQPVDARQLQGALGADVIGELAERFGLSQDEVGGQLAEALPQVVDHVTPGGGWPDATQAGAADGGGIAELQDIGELLRRFEAR